MPALIAAVLAVAALATAAVTARRRLVVVRVHGVSMEPTLRDGQRVVVRRAGLDAVRTGQLVVFATLVEDPADGPLSGDPPWMVKRAVAVPGDPVPAELASPGGGSGARVPPGRLVAFGDNRSASFDSRRAGFVDGSTLLGVVRRVL
jgi:signal peptidase I